MVLSWTGRRSGRRFAIPVGYQPAEDAVIVLISKVDEKTWWKNFRDPWAAELTIRGQAHSATGTWVTPGSDEFHHRIERTLRRLPWMGRQFGIEYARGETLDTAKRGVLESKVGVVRFELDDREPGSGVPRD